MKVMLLILGFYAVLLHAACDKNTSQNPVAGNEATPLQEVKQPANSWGHPQKKPQAKSNRQISKEEAIAIANEDVAKTYQSITAFKVVACKQRFLWLIIYDGEGLEYFIGKSSGEILGVRRVPHSLDEAGSDPKDHIAVNQAEAIEIAKKDFVDLFIENENAGRQPRKIEIAKKDFIEIVNQYNPVACELTHSWRIFFEHKLKRGQNPDTLPTSDTPDYVIDKKTGKIIYRQQY